MDPWIMLDENKKKVKLKIDEKQMHIAIPINENCKNIMFLKQDNTEEVKNIKWFKYIESLNGFRIWIMISGTILFFWILMNTFR